MDKGEDKEPDTMNELRERLEEAEETLHAIRSGQVDALVVSGPRGDQVYVLEGAEHPYRLMVESMNEGAVVLTDDGTIYYSNRSFAAMLELPLEQVMGATMRLFVVPEDLQSYEVLVQQAREGNSKGEIRLKTNRGSALPVDLSLSLFEASESRNLCAVVTDLTPYKRNQELLASNAHDREIRVAAEAARERITNILESITDGFFALNREWRITYINQRAASIMEKTRAELIGLSVWEFLLPGTEEVREKYEKAMTERVPVHFEGPAAIASVSNKDRWFEWHVYPTEEGLAVYLRDITERKQAEEALRLSEAHLAEAQRIGHIGSWVWNVSTGELFWSLEHFRMFGVDPASFKPTKENTQRMIHPEDLPRVEQALERAVRDRSNFEVDYRVIRPDGSIRHHRGIGHPVVKESGYLEFVGTVIDVTESEQAEDALRRSEAYLAEGQKISHTGSWALNVRTRELFWSPEHFRICGLDPETSEITIERARELIHPDDRISANQAFDRAVQERIDFERHFRFVRPGGTIRYVHSLAHPVFDESGELKEYIGTVADITEQKIAEDALRQARAELIHVSRLTTMGELAASLAHELNQSLAAIVTNGDACLRWLGRPEPDLGEATSGIQRMIGDAKRAGEVIAHTRTLLKKSVGERTAIDTTEIIREVLVLVHGELERQRIVLHDHLAEDLPKVVGVRAQLQQVVLNLVINAVEAMAEVSGRSRDLVIRSRRYEFENRPGLLVTVQDAGVGVAEENLNRIFEGFYTTKVQGLGLGLSISRSIIEAHGGRLWPSRNSEHGMTLQFILPCG
jgi:PAS domain S-box-containing protein